MLLVLLLALLKARKRLSYDILSVEEIERGVIYYIEKRIPVPYDDAVLNTLIFIRFPVIYN